MSQKLTKDQIMKIPLLKETMGVHEIAAHFNVGVRTIHYWIVKLKKAGYKIKRDKAGRKPIVLA